MSPAYYPFGKPVGATPTVRKAQSTAEESLKKMNEAAQTAVTDLNKFVDEKNEQIARLKEAEARWRRNFESMDAARKRAEDALNAALDEAVALRNEVAELKDGSEVRKWKSNFELARESNVELSRKVWQLKEQLEYEKQRPAVLHAQLEAMTKHCAELMAYQVTKIEVPAGTFIKL